MKFWRDLIPSICTGNRYHCVDFFFFFFYWGMKDYGHEAIFRRQIATLQDEAMVMNYGSRVMHGWERVN